MQASSNNLYMDVHKNVAVSHEELLRAHMRDVEAQWKYGVKYLRYWYNEPSHTVFCLVEAPSAEAATKVHIESAGLPADEIIEVGAATVEGYFGATSESNEPSTLPPVASGRTELDPGLRTIMFTDMEGSTPITQRMGDEKAYELLAAHDTIIRDALREHGGREVKHTGDGIMASFVSARHAVECATAIQRTLSERNRGAPDQPIRIRIGLSAGEPVDAHQDIFGAAVQLAARACNHAQPGQILAANVVRELCIGKGFSFIDQGEVPLKGFEEPVHLYEVG
jgi:class 3 adenylate cyclase